MLKNLLKVVYFNGVIVDSEVLCFVNFYLGMCFFVF